LAGVFPRPILSQRRRENMLIQILASCDNSNDTRGN
jgi:hypothetical protein